MKPSVYQIESPAPGRLFIMPKPSGEWLREDIAHYRLMGVDTVVSLLEPEEERELSLGAEGRICREDQMEFFAFPIPDRGLPEPDGLRDLVAQVADRLRKGKGVAVHCRAGIGRSGMVVCCALRGFLGSAEEAIALVSAARGTEVPDTIEQRRLIEDYARETEDGRGRTLDR